MAISRFSTSSVAQGLPKYQKLWDNTTQYTPPSYEQIATSVVGAGGTSTVTFSSIPQTYKHLELRGSFSATGADQNMIVRVGNGSIDSGSNYNGHILTSLGNGSVVRSYTISGTTCAFVGLWYDANSMSGFVANLMDYTSTTKYKTFKSMFGNDNNSTNISFAGIGSNSWMNTSAVNTLSFGTSGLFNQYSVFSLYGIRG